jgi:hypothetical protein
LKTKKEYTEKNRPPSIDDHHTKQLVRISVTNDESLKLTCLEQNWLDGAFRSFQNLGQFLKNNNSEEKMKENHQPEGREREKLNLEIGGVKLFNFQIRLHNEEE